MVDMSALRKLFSLSGPLVTLTLALGVEEHIMQFTPVLTQVVGCSWAVGHRILGQCALKPSRKRTHRPCTNQHLKPDCPLKFESGSSLAPSLTAVLNFQLHFSWKASQSCERDSIDRVYRWVHPYLDALVWQGIICVHDIGIPWAVRFLD